MVEIILRGDFPIVKPSPTVDDCWRVLRPRDYINWAAATAGGWAFGFARGRPARFHFAGLGSAIGFTAGSFIVLIATRNRLMGLRENAREVAKYGVYQEPEPFVVKDSRYPEAVKPQPMGKYDWNKFN